MTLLPQHQDWYNQLIEACKPSISESEWWIIGGQMHTIDGDYRLLHPELSVQDELDKMWAAWISVDPRKKVIE